MAATDKTLRDQRTLDIVFAVSNIVMLLSVVWMLWQDFNREYKADQRAFRDVEVAMAQHAALAQIPSLEEFKAKKEKVEEERKFREQNKTTVEEIQAKVRSLQPKREIADAAYQAAKAEVDSKNSFLEILLEEGDANAVEKMRNTLAGLKTALAEKQAERDKIVNEMKEEQLKIDKYEAPYTKAVAEFKKVNDKFDAQVKLALTKEWGWGDWFRTQPVINGFADPLKIHQLTINDIPIDYNFKYVTRFDRCMTCHLAIDRPAYTRENLAALKTAGQDKLLTNAIELYKQRTAVLDPKDAASIPNPEKIHLLALGDKTLSPGRITEFTAHPRLDLFVGSGSKHPAEKFGCSSCHYGQGSGTTFVDSAHSPNSGATREEWEQTKHWTPSHDWDFPMLPHRFIESSCLKCHHEVTDLISSDNRVEAPKVVRGFNLIKDNGCFGCHEINGWKSGNRVGPDLRLEPSPPLQDLTPLERDRAINDPDNRPGTLRKVGPALSRVSEKVKDGWIEKWLYKPSGFRPDTKMPHYFNLSTNDPKALKEFDKTNGIDKDGKPNPDFLKQENFPNTEIASIAHFLTVTSKNFLAGIAQHENDAPAAKAADEHRLLELDNKGRLDAEEQKEFNAIKERMKFRKEMKPVKEDPVLKGKADVGRKLFIERGCLACHTHQGTEAADVTSAAVFGPNLSQLPAKIGTSAEAHQWLTRWILDPKAYSPRTRMPQTHLEPQEAADVAAWLLSEKAMDLGTGWDDVKIPAPAMKDLQDLATVYLTRMLSKNDIALFFKGRKADNNDLAVTVMLNDVTDDEKKLFENVADENAMKYYLGKKAVNRLGCFGCHDIPGFENAKPIGTGLNDWGKKPADRLAFEDIGNFFKNHYYSTYTDSKGGEKNVDATFADNGKRLGVKEIGGESKEPYEKFYADALLGHHPERMGYLNQKIRAPRSYDFNRVRTWDDRARMPKFTFSRPRRHKDEGDADFQGRVFKEEAEAREAVASFILGLTAEMVPVKMTNQPTGDRLREVKGRQVIDQFNCAGCHLVRPGSYDFKPSATALERLNAAFQAQSAPMKEQGEIVFLNHINWVGRNPLGGDRLTAYGVHPRLEKDLFNPDVPPDDQPGYSYLTIRLSEALRFGGANKVVDNIPASAPIYIPLADLTSNPAALKSQADFDRAFAPTAPLGGTFADLLVPYLIRKDPRKYLKTPDGDSSEARASLPPALIGQGERTQPDWLYDFLLNPTKVRRMAILQMPKFNMSKDEAKALVDYFAGVTRQINPGIGLAYPYQDIAQRDDLDRPDSYWTKKTEAYIARLKTVDANGKPLAKDKGIANSAYAQRIAAYTPVWEQLRKEQEKALQEKIKKAEGALTATAKAKTDAEKAGAGAKGAEKKKLDEEIDALGLTLKTIAADKQQAEKSLADLDVKTLRKNWEEKEAYAADGYRLLTSRKLCLQCHPIGDFTASEPNKQGPPLALASQRLRPGFIERWVDKPQRFVPYASLMPPYFDKNKDQYQQLHAGPALDQIDTLRDVLLNFPRVSSLPINRIYDPDQPAAK